MLNVSKGPEGGRTMAEEKRGVQLGEIAERLGISRSTVSFVLNGRGDEMRISKQTQERIRRTAREMDYQPNLNAQRLRHSASGIQSQSIAMFWCDHYGAETLGRFISGGCSSGRESGLQTEYALHIFHYDELHQYRELLSSNYYSGIVINGGSDNDIEFLSQVNFQVPAVFSGRSVSGISCPVHISVEPPKSSVTSSMSSSRRATFFSGEESVLERASGIRRQSSGVTASRVWVRVSCSCCFWVSRSRFSS